MDDYFMEYALQLAEAGRGQVSPNPLVGAVLVRDGKIIGEGCHAGYGGPHAEQAAIENALQQGNDPRGSVLYCTLEPCSFTSPEKHNPPCTLAIRRHGISEVVIAIEDPNPQVSGSGIEQLQQAGISVRTGICAAAAVRQNEAYILARENKRPYIHLKWAQSLDGSMAAHSGDSKWISSASARIQAHTLRAASDAVLVGGGTAAYDDPQLTVRLPGDSNPTPLRVAVSSQANIDVHSHLYTEAGRIPTRVYCSKAVSSAAIIRLETAGITAVQVDYASDSPAAGLDLQMIFRDLYQSGIQSVLVEGGPRLHGSLLAQGLYDRITVFTEPLFLGRGMQPTAGLSVPTVASAIRLEQPEYMQYGTTMAVSGRHPAAAALLQQYIPHSTEETLCSPV